ncbi:MAG: LPS export ABC transporter periplasmic protein LptC [Bacteroidales bacterium]|jgi:LPS export ABC transporter protein LptC|nr:LPS export ABC transporter periplasmic protein LptC [Bacteroidales bacterium]
MWILVLAITAGSFACQKKIETIRDADILTLPSLTVRDFETVYTDSGKLQLILSAPLMESYNNNEEPYSEFRSGINVFFHDGHRNPVGSVKAKYAKYTENKTLWELKDSVIAVNESGDRLETELLYWDQKKELIYTDRFVKITNEDQIVQGFGFESDPRLTRRKIKNVSATIYVSDNQ